MTCEIEHKRVVEDTFAELRGITRLVPGDCYCLDCRKPLPALWNGGQPKWIEEQDTPHVNSNSNS